MQRGTHYMIEFEGVGTPASTVCTRSEEEVMAFATRHLGPGTELFVACLGAGLDHGNLIVSAQNDASFRLVAHSHRGFIARAVSREQALSALGHWLPGQERWAALHWRAE